ncbi:MAG: hypothetical protein K2K22_00040, partial [Muribaculaceae bacterium]|nr:hypothetical protein [Muribaculaceae bacterium]
MKNIGKVIASAALAASVPTLAAQEGDIVATAKYRWHGDTVTQAEYMATAPSEYEIVSTYSAQPG